MKINSLNIYNFRNIKNTSLEFHSKINCFYGNNASGKTNLLEAIYYSTHLKSFKDIKISKLINIESDVFALLMKTYSADNDRECVNEIKLKYSKSAKSLKANCNHQKIEKVSSIVRQYPILFLYPELIKLIDLGPSQRRKFLDFGVFHVEHSDNYSVLIKKLNYIVKNRNTLLKKKSKTNQFDYWNEVFIDVCGEINRVRLRYIEILSKVFGEISKSLQLSDNIILEYYPGWNIKGGSFEEQLYQNHKRDLINGYSSIGSHRADLRIKDDSNAIDQTYSRGQKKMFLLCLMFSHLKLLENKSPILIIDDVRSELDKKNIKIIFDLIKNKFNNSQIFITDVDESVVSEIEEGDYSMFHVEHGKIIKKL